MSSPNRQECPIDQRQDGPAASPYIFSQPSKNRKHKSIDTMPRRNIAGSRSARFNFTSTSAFASAR